MPLSTAINISFITFLLLQREVFLLPLLEKKPPHQASSMSTLRILHIFLAASERIPWFCSCAHIHAGSVFPNTALVKKLADSDSVPVSETTRAVALLLDTRTVQMVL